MMRFFTRCNVYLAVLTLVSGLLLCSGEANGQVNVSGANPSSNGVYSTLKLAFDAINTWDQTGTSIVVTISSNTTEDATAVLNAGFWTTLQIYPLAAGISITNNLNNTPLIILNGADNVTLDGRVGRTGTSKALTLSNTYTGANAPAIQLTNDAQGNTIKYCNIKGRSTGSASGVVVVDASAGTSGNDNLLIDNCDIDATSSAVNCIYASGTAPAMNNSVTVSNCNLYDYRGNTSAGINMASYNQDWTINNNSFYQTAAYAGIPGVTYGIYIGTTGAGSNTLIYNNYIGGSSANCAGTWTINTTNAFRFVGMYLNFSSAAGSKVYNNTISSFSWLTSSNSSGSLGVWAGIFINSGSVNIGTDGANTIGSSTGNGNITVTLNSTSKIGEVYGIATEASSINTLNIENNSIGSITAQLGSGIATSRNSLYPVNVKNSTGTCSINNNLIGSSTTANSINAAPPSNATYAPSITGIYSSTTGSISITNNSIFNLNNASVFAEANQYNRGIQVTASTGTVNISGNLVSDITASQPMTGTGAASNIIGISMEANNATGVTVAGNTVYNLKNTDPGASVNVLGMYYNGPTSGTNTVSKNFIHSLSVSSSSATAGINGLRINAGTTTFSNNIINLGSAIANGNIIYGMYENGATGTTNSLYHNTVYIGGTAAVAANTAALYSNTQNNIRNFRNNIFVNARSGLGGSHYAAFFNYGVSTGITLEYNTYYAPNTGGVLGRFNNANVNSLPLISGKDLNSTTLNPQFALAGGTSAAYYKPGAPSGGANTGITTDYANTPRNCAFTMGAFEVEVTVGTPVFNLGPSSTRCQGAATVTYTVTATATTGITYSLDGASLSGGNSINTATGAVTYVASWTGPSTITAVAAGCNGPSSPAVHTVTITAAPEAPTGTSPQVYCNTQTVASLTTTTGTNILWYLAASGGNALAASDPLGNNTYYASQTVGGCESVARLPVTVQVDAPNQVSAIAASNPTPCPNTAGLVYSVTNTSRTTYTWTVPPGWIISAGQGTNSITVTSGSAGQNGNIEVSAANSCGASTSGYAVSVTAPQASIVPDYCTYAPKIGLTALPGGYTYQWYKDGKKRGTNPGYLVDSAAIYTVIVTNSNGCTGSASITLSTELVIDGNFENFDPLNISFSSDYTYKADLPGLNNELYPEKTYGVGTDPQAFQNYFWGRDHTSGGGNFMIINGSPLSVAWSQTITGLSPNTDYYFSAWGISLNSTGNTNNAQLQFRINNGNVGNIVNLPDRKATNDPPYNWLKFYGVWNSGSSTTAVLEIVDLQDAAGGNDFGLDDISFGTLVPTFMSLNALANGGGPVCEEGTINLSVSINGGRPPYTFEWKDPSGNIISTDPYPSISNATTANNGVYTVVIHDDFGCAPATDSTSFITVLPTPTATISEGASVCLNDPTQPQLTFTGSGSTEPYTFTYHINLGPDLTVTTTSGSSVSVDVPTNVAGDFTYTLTKVAGNTGCARTLTTPQAKTFTVRGINAALSRSAASICEGQSAPTITFTGSGTGTGIAPPYIFNYTLNGVAQTPLTTVSGSSISVSVPATAGTYVYNVTSVAGSGCTQYPADTISVSVNARPVISIAGPTSICGVPNAGIIYTTEPGMSNYTWSVSAGGTITSGTTGNSVTVTWTAVGIPTLSVNYTGTNGCAAISPQILPVGVNTGAPAPPTAIPFTNQYVCAPANGIAYTVNYIAGVTYTWSYSGTGANINNQGSSAITIDFAANATNGTLSVIASNACGSNATASNRDIVISTPRTANAGPDQTVCSSNPGVSLNGSYSSGSGTSPTVQWSGGAGTYAPNANTLNTVYTPSAAEVAAGTVTLTLAVTSGTCSPPSTDQMVITINQAATVNAGSNQTICFGDTITLTGSIGGSATSATWNTGLGLIYIPNNTTLNAKFTTSTATNKTLTLTTNDPAGPCPAATSQIVITVNPKPIISGTMNVCVGSSVQLTGSPTPAGTTPWTSATPAVATTNSTGLITGITPGTSVVTYINNNSCKITTTMTVNALPNPTASSNTPVCVGGTINLAGGPVSMSSYSWVGPNGFTSNPLLTSVTQNFDGMGSSGTATLPVGFKIGTNYSTGTTSTILAYGTAGTGVVTSSSTGGIINWANGITSSSADRALGVLNAAGYTSPRSIMYAFTNFTGNTINTINLAWNYEKYRSGSSACTWNFFHGPTSTATIPASAGDLAYEADANNTVVFNPPSTAAKSFSVSGLSIAPGATYYLRWTLSAVNIANGQGLGIDDFSLNYVTGGTQNPSLPVATDAMGGTYTLTAVNSNGCSNTALTTVVIANQWKGTNSSNWDDFANWSCPFPTAATDVIIPSIGVPHFPEVNITNAACRNLSINNAASLQINSGQALTVNGNVTNNGTLTINSDDLSNNGSLIVEGNTSGSGNIIYDRYLSTDRNFITSSPVNVTSGFSALNKDKMYNSSLDDYNFASFDEPSNSWNYYNKTSYPFPDALSPGQGYIAKFISPFTNLTYSGGSLNGNLSIPLSNSSAITGWNAVGNPYTSAIRITDEGTYKGFISQNTNALDPQYQAVYLWNQTGSYTGNEQYYTCICNSGYTPVRIYNGPLTDEKYVQAGQGFLINLNYIGPNSIVFIKGTTSPNGMQLHSPTVTMKKNQTSWPGITLLATTGGRTRSTVVAFSPDMTTGLDPSYDAGLLSVSDFNLYTRLVAGANETNFTIQSLPDNTYETLEVPVGLDMPQAGEVTFKADGIILPEGVYPVIEDRLTHISVPLKTLNDSLTAYLAEPGWGTGRFYLHFGNTSTLDINEQRQVQLFTAFYSSQEITLLGTPETGSHAWLYDVNGRKLGGEYLLTSFNKNIIPARGLANGIYLLRIEGKTTQQTLKVTILNR